MSDESNSSSETSSLPRWLNKWTIGAFAVVVGVAGALYTLTRPTKPKKIRKRTDNNRPKTKKYERVIHRKPLDIHLVMRDAMTGQCCHVAADKKNKKLDLVIGSALIKINGEKVENLPFDQIQLKLQSARYPVTLAFREFPDFQGKWQEADQLKERANEVYKENRTDQALEIMQRAIDLHPTNKVYYSNRVLMLLKMKDYDSALEDCQIMRELDPLSLYVKGHYLRGLVLMNLEKYKHARSAFQTVLKINSGFKKASERLEECLQKLAELDRSPEEDQKEPDENAVVENGADGFQPAAEQPDQQQQQQEPEQQPEEPAAVISEENAQPPVEEAAASEPEVVAEPPVSQDGEGQGNDEAPKGEEDPVLSVSSI